MKDTKRYLLILLMFTTLGCTSDEDKIQKIFDARIAECLMSSGDFFEVKRNKGKDEILRAACEIPPTPPRLKDEFHAKIKTGPYNWLFGVDDETGVWVLATVQWEELEQARRHLEGGDTQDVMERAEEKLKIAQEALPDNAWIRVSRVENALRLRTKLRGKDKETTTTLGAAGPIYEENLKWADEKSKPAAAKIRVAYLDHYAKYKAKLEMARKYLGSQDEAYEASIEAAVKEKDEKTIKNYTEELEKMRAERPAMRKLLTERLGKQFDATCKVVAELSTEGLEDDADLIELVNSHKSGVNCSPDARPKLEEAPTE